MTRTPDEIKKGLECCSSTANCADGCPYHVIVEGSFGCDEMGCEDGLLPDALALIQQLEYALALMVVQYSQDGDGAVTHLWMEAGERAFETLGIKNYTPAEVVHEMCDRMEAEMAAKRKEDG